MSNSEQSNLSPNVQIIKDEKKLVDDKVINKKDDSKTNLVKNAPLAPQVISNFTDNFDFDEEILKEENQRFTVFPIKYPSIWKLYKKQLEAFWKVEEIDFSGDKNDYMSLTTHEQTFIKMVLAFFAASDGIVNFNLRERFLKDVKPMEAQITYGYQMMIEAIHGEGYSLMLENIVEDKDEREFLFNAIQTVPSVKAMADWAFKWIQSTASFGFRLIAFAIVEGVFFSGAFASIFWLKKYRSQGKHFMNGLIKSNEFISRDEGMHVELATHLYKLLKHRLSKELVYQIMDEAVKISVKFTDDALQTKLIGMNQDLMEQYIKYIGDRLLVSLGYEKFYNEENPFDFMETIGMIRKTNFFETRPTEYKSAYSAENKVVKQFKVLDDY